MKEFQMHKQVKKKSSNKIIRELWVCNASEVGHVKDDSNFPSASQVGYLRKSTYVNGKLVKQEAHYGITSLTREEFPPEQLLDVTRKHWEIENGLHHVKDRSWLEDKQYSNSCKKGGMLGRLRNFSLNAMRVIYPAATDRKKRRHQKSLPIQAISYFAKPVEALNQLYGI